MSGTRSCESMQTSERSRTDFSGGATTNDLQRAGIRTPRRKRMIEGHSRFSHPQQLTISPDFLAFQQSNIDSVAPPHQPNAEWNCRAAYTVPGGLLGDNCNDLLGRLFPDQDFDLANRDFQFNNILFYVLQVLFQRRNGTINSSAELHVLRLRPSRQQRNI